MIIPRGSLVAVIILLVLITVGFVYLKSADPEITPVITQTIDHSVSDDAVRALELHMEEERSIIDSADPDALIWKKGETGEFIIGVRNIRDVDTTFFFRLILDRVRITEERAPMTEGWAVFPKKKTIPSQEIEFITISLLPVNPPTGTYLYQIDVCETADCSLLYVSETFSFRII